MNEASWPIFIAAPFIVPSVSTSRSADSSATLVHALLAARPSSAPRSPPWRPRSARPRARRACRRAPSGPGAACGMRVVGRGSSAIAPTGSAASRYNSRAPMAQGRPNTPDARAARGARLARQPPPAPRRASCPASIYGIGERRRRRSRSTRAGCARCSAEGHALFDVEVDGGERQPVIVKDQQRDPVRGHVVHIDLLQGAARREDPVDRRRSSSRASRRRPASRRAACSSTSPAS